MTVALKIWASVMERVGVEVVAEWRDVVNFTSVLAVLMVGGGR